MPGIRTMATFKREVAALGQQQFDVAIVGGGISGAWLAYHCARSGYRTALIEQSDFASQTSSSSSKLLHGGIRYLQQMQFAKVRESALERAQYIFAAPHLSKPIPFLVPTYKDFARSKVFLKCGMLAYRLLTLGENKIIERHEEFLPPIKSLAADELQSILDLGNEPHTGAVMFYERHMVNSERMVLAVIKSAAHAGAVVANYCSATALLRDEQNNVCGLQATDLLSDQSIKISAKLVINAAGPWIDDLNTSIKPNGERNITGFAVGSHIITRQVSKHAIALTTKHQSNAKLDRGGRHVFVIPWRGFSLIGTSYHEIATPAKNLLPETSHVEELIEAVNHSLPHAQLSNKDLVSGFSGLYPLRTDNIKSTVYQGSGEYSIIDHADSDQLQGLITALGAKFTTGRKLSALTMPRVQKKLGGVVKLDKSKLHNANYQSFAEFSAAKQAQYKGLLPTATLDHLIHEYGSEVDALLELASGSPALLTPISVSQPDIRAQIVWALEQEQAQTLEDILFRRTAIGFLGISSAEVESVADLAGDFCNWTVDVKKKQITDVVTRLNDIATVLRSAQIT